ncbi:MAG: NAD-dependent epimerase/dehydratase family protein, partial [Candidatus Marinimicrobia bacterium]|nr:NAD-dependent epimerase/dehydratase family protein [Candidatus Neomarinimicrobiota bacterium]
EEYLLTGPLEPTNEPYAIAKIAGIKMCENYYRQYGCNFYSVMPTNLYGPNDNFNLETSHVLPAILRKVHLAKCLENDDWQSIQKDLDKNPIEIINGKSSQEDILKILSKYGINLSRGFTQMNTDYNKNNISVNSCVKDIRQLTDNSRTVSLSLWGSGSPRREFLYSDDLADAVVFLMNNYDASDIGDFINIGTGKDLTIKELADMIRNIVGFKGEIDWDSSKPDGTLQKLLDVSLLNQKEWRSKTTLKEGIRKSYISYTK